MKPKEWRCEIGLSQDRIARQIGIEGKNPSRTWQRWESGERPPPIRIVVAVERMSEGKVTAESWHDARVQYLEREHRAAKRRSAAVEARA